MTSVTSKMAIPVRSENANEIDFEMKRMMDEWVEQLENDAA
jgi:hypothetical protein